MTRICWAMLHAAEFDALANELIEMAETFRDPAAFIPRRMAELAGTDHRLEQHIDHLTHRVARLEIRLETMSNGQSEWSPPGAQT